MMVFKAILIEKDQDGYRARYVELASNQLMEGDVEIDVSHSAINFKDGLAITGAGPVVRRFPMIPGVDLAGTVTRSSHPEFIEGDRVVACGCGLGEAHYGGFAQKARLSGDWLSKLPEALTPEQAMTIGTAGVTAAFCIMALENFGMTPDRGQAVVTGAAGGVGSFAVALLAQAGWRVAALTGRPEEETYLRALGAEEILDRSAFAAPGKALQNRRFAVGVDTVGSATLVNVLAQTDYDGAVAACGNVGGMDLPGNVAPFILRGVSLLGVESVRPRIRLRRKAWERLGADLSADLLAMMSETIPFSAALERAKAIVGGKIRGRVVVDLAG
jgi:acrylyl-CoA reductase (NADPH)